jgi:hypothetical protein
MFIDQYADEAEHLIAMARREMLMHPRSPVAVSRETKEAIDISGIMAMPEEQQLEMLRQLEAA